MRHISELTKNLPASIPRYTEYRKRFLDVSRRQNLKILTADPEIKTDFSYSDTNHETTLVSLGGVHGAEGYLGSDIQCEIIQNLPTLLQKQSPDKGINIVFAHAVNAFGMAHYRRANANNVDLNRNSINHIEAKARTSKFDKFLFLMESQSSAEYRRRLPKALITALWIGRKQAIEAVANGQFHFPKSLFYGGMEWQPELIELFSTLKKLFPLTKKWVILDIHSGLGEFKQESLIIDGDPSTQEVDFFQKTLQAELIVPKTNPKYYTTQGSLRFGLVEKMPGEVFHLTQEFGTYSFLTLIEKLSIENAMFHQRKELDPIAVQGMIKCFYPDQSDWKQSCINRGIDRWRRLYENLF